MTTLCLKGRTRPLVVASMLCALMLSGCSMARLAYNQADWLVLQRLDGYVDLTDAQSMVASEALLVAHQRHRRSVLPAFADALTDASTRVRRGLSEEDLRHIADTSHVLLTASLEQVLPAVSAALVGLSREQQAHLAAQIAERNEEYIDRHRLDRPREERLAHRAERAVSRIEEWTGALSAEQVALVHALRNEMPDSGARWLEHRRLQQRRLLALIADGASATDVEAFLRQWWTLKQDLPQDLARFRERQTEGYINLLVRLGATLDSVQREHLARRLDGLARDARELAVET